jgi:hypothetical protein
MAKLSAHGVEIGRIELVTRTRAYFQDRTVLENYGYGWKVKGKIKADVDPVTHYNQVVKGHAEKLDKNPAFKKWYTLIIKEPLSFRRYLIAGLELLSDDLDGLYSELDDNPDTRGRWSLEDLKEYVDAYKDALDEMNYKFKEPRVITAQEVKNG